MANAGSLHPRHETDRSTAAAATSGVSAGGRRARAAAVALIVLVGVVYAMTIPPDVRAGDSAELQMMSALLGVCHPPGYGLLVGVAHLFTRLPFGPDAAWRVNLLMAICGLAGVLLLFAILRRLTGRLMPAFATALTLAFSIQYWTHSIVAEVYIFHAVFLLLGLYALLRFLETDRGNWLYLTAFSLGICIGGRLSELTVLPAFVALWWFARHRVRLDWKRLATAGVLACLPFLLNAGFFLWRTAAPLPPIRDDALRDEILDQGPPVADLPVARRLKEALLYTAGVRGRGRQHFTEFSWWRIGWDLNKYAWQLSGLAARGDRFPEELRRSDPILAFRQREQGSGTSITALGVVLALTSFRHWRRRKHALLCGSLLFLGNLAYYLYMHPVDNLQFTLPGLIGLSILIAWGITPSLRGDLDRSPSSRPEKQPMTGRRRMYVLYTLGMIPPFFLVLSNVSVFNYAAPAYRENMKQSRLVIETPMPDNTVIISTYPPAQRMRYLYWAAAKRTDVRVMVFREEFDVAELRKLVETLRSRGFFILLGSEIIGKTDAIRIFAQWTREEYIALGLYQAFPPGPR